MEIPRYITQIDANWLEEVSKTANLDTGKGLKVEDLGDRKRIVFDEDALKLMIYAILKKTVGVTGFRYVTPADYTLDYQL